MKLALITGQMCFISFGGRSAVYLIRLWRYLDNFYKSLFNLKNHINPTDVIDSNMHKKVTVQMV